jgi:phospholipase C
MAPKVTRRRFLTLAAGATALSLGGRPKSSVSLASGEAPTGGPLPAPADAPFDTVVVLMMENRSFDHLLGWLAGANGQQEGLRYRDCDEVEHSTWHLAREDQPDFQGCDYGDPDHTWQGIEKQYADGRCDGFLKTPAKEGGDLFPIGYYREDDLPILSALAKGYTTFDNYFCSMMGPTWQNRLYQLTGTTQLTPDCDFPGPGEPRPVTIETAIFDRVRGAGLTAGYYYHDEPMTKIFESRKYDGISCRIDQFWVDAHAGTLPNVVFVDPNFSDRAEDMGTSNDYHPWGNVLVGDGFVAQAHDVLTRSPQWDRMVFVLNFDEHGGFFDHVPPPACEDDTELRRPRSRAGDDQHCSDVRVGPLPNLKRLGFRVPAIAMSPFAPRKIEKAGPYEHCSILKMIEWRWGLEPMRLRDRRAKNLAEALDFTRRREPIDLPPFDPPPPLGCQKGGGWTDLSVSRRGRVRVLREGPPWALFSGRLTTGEDPRVDLATAAPRRIGPRTKVVLEMTLNGVGRELLATASNRLPALLETTVVAPNGSICRGTSSVFLTVSPATIQR